MASVSHLRANCTRRNITRSILHMLVSQKCCSKFLLRLRNPRIGGTINAMDLKIASFLFHWDQYHLIFTLSSMCIYYTLVSSKRSPPAARRKQIATKSIIRPTKTPLAVASNILIAVIMPLKNRNIYICINVQMLAYCTYN